MGPFPRWNQLQNFLAGGAVENKAGTPSESHQLFLLNVLASSLVGIIQLQRAPFDLGLVNPIFLISCSHLIFPTCQEIRPDQTCLASSSCLWLNDLAGWLAGWTVRAERWRRNPVWHHVIIWWSPDIPSIVAQLAQLSQICNLIILDLWTSKDTLFIPHTISRKFLFIWEMFEEREKQSYLSREREIPPRSPADLRESMCGLVCLASWCQGLNCSIIGCH